MNTVVHAPADEELNLLLDWKQVDRDTHVKTAAAFSLAYHLLLVIGLALVPGSAPPSPVQVTVRRVTPLVDPPTQLTQKAPNKGKLSKDLNAEAIRESPRVQTPAPAPPSKRFIAPPGPPKVARNVPTPAVAVPEPPKLEPPLQSQTPGASLTQITPPQIQAQEKPKLSFETPGAPPAANAKPTGRVPAPNTSVSEAVRNLSRDNSGGGQTVGDMDTGATGPGLNLPASPGRPRSNLELLSDPQGVDFRPYLLRVLATVRRNWFAVMPESANLGARGKVVVQFAIAKDGNINKVVFGSQSGARALDQAAVAALSASNPLPPLPAEFHGDRVVLQFTFLYNIALK